MRSIAGLLILVVALFSSACSGSADDPTDRTWQLTELEGSSPVDGTTIDMTIEDETVFGSSGCNSYNGPATVGEGTMTLGPDFAVTFMACETPIMDQEQKYLAALSRVTTYEMANDTLSLLDEDGIAVAVFE